METSETQSQGRPHPSARVGCGSCFHTLHREDPDETRRAMVKCAVCSRLYHQGCWSGRCDALGCTSTTCLPVPPGEAPFASPLPPESPQQEAKTSASPEYEYNLVAIAIAVVISGLLLGGVLATIISLLSRPNRETNPPPNPEPARRPTNVVRPGPTPPATPASNEARAIRPVTNPPERSPKPAVVTPPKPPVPVPLPPPPVPPPVLDREAVRRDYQTLTVPQTHHRIAEVLAKLATEEPLKRWKWGEREGMAAAIFLMGLCHHHGIGGSADLAEAARRYETASGLGDTAAQAALGRCLLLGEGTPRDEARAVVLLAKAAQANRPEAQTLLGWCHLRGLGVPRESREAFRLFQLAQNSGYAEAKTGLASCYERGRGTPRDLPLARQLLTEALAAGLSGVQPELDRISALLDRSPQTLTLSLPLRSDLALVEVPAGSFKRGSTEDERTWAAGPEGQGTSEELAGESGEPSPRAIPRPFFVGRTEITVAQWEAFVRATGHKTDAERSGRAWSFDSATHLTVRTTNVVGGIPYVRSSRLPREPAWDWMEQKDWRRPGHAIRQEPHHPVTCVSPRDAVAFCAWLTTFANTNASWPAGMVCRLPTETEWEYACRAGLEEARFWWGDEPEFGGERANLAGGDALGGANPQLVWKRRFPWSDSFPWVSPVNSFKEGRNVFGLADMLGNVWEWCQDPGLAPIARGGSFASPPALVRAAARRSAPEGFTAADIGFRVVIAPPL